MMKKELIREAARDLIALGSIPFLALTLVRVCVEVSYYFMQFAIASTVFFILKAVFKAEMHAGVAAILLIFTSLFYHHALFAAFALITYAGIIWSLFYLGKEKGLVIKGIFFGLLSAGVSYLAVLQVYFRK